MPTWVFGKFKKCLFSFFALSPAHQFTSNWYNDEVIVLFWGYCDRQKVQQILESTDYYKCNFMGSKPWWQLAFFLIFEHSQMLYCDTCHWSFLWDQVSVRLLIGTKNFRTINTSPVFKIVHSKWTKIGRTQFWSRKRLTPPSLKRPYLKNYLFENAKILDLFI